VLDLQIPPLQNNNEDLKLSHLSSSQQLLKLAGILLPEETMVKEKVYFSA